MIDLKGGRGRLQVLMGFLYEELLVLEIIIKSGG